MIIKSLFDFFLPRLCFSCSSKLLPGEDSVCPSCLSRFAPALEDRIKGEYAKKFAGKRIVSSFHSMYVFEKGKEFQQVIHSLKYQKKFKAGIFLGRKLGEYYNDTIRRWGAEVIIPVPLHKIKKLERGYNQSCYIALGISKITGLPVAEKALIRQKNTLSQTNMNLSEREKNVSDAFRVLRKEIIRNKTILLVDDVITTGATINECGRVLKENGAGKIYALSSAIADLTG